MSLRKLSFSPTVLIAVLLTSCLPGNGTKTGKAFETYYVGDGINQYFVAPLKFKAENMTFNCDFTYRDKNDSVTCNYSIFADQPFVNFDYIGFEKNGGSINLYNSKKLFVEKQKKQFHSRYTSQLSRASFIELFHLEELKPIFKSGDTQASFKASSASQKSSKKVESNLITILELEN